MAYFVGAYWGQREESRQACADRMSVFLHALAKQDAALSNWFKKTASRKAPLVALPHDTDGLGTHLRTNQRDIGGEAIAELGFNFSAWTGREVAMPPSLAATCGAYSPVVRNSVVVSFDPAAQPTPDLLQGILRAAVTAFDPEDAVVSSTERLSAHASLPAWKAPAVVRFKLGSGFSAD
jgi:hypothetical protein